MRSVIHSPLVSIGRNGAHRSICPVTKWPPNRSPTATARSRLTRLPCSEHAERRPSERFGPDVERHRFRIGRDDRQTTAIHGDTFAERNGQSHGIGNAKPLPTLPVRRDIGNRADRLNESGKHSVSLQEQKRPTGSGGSFPDHRVFDQARFVFHRRRIAAPTMPKPGRAEED